MGTILERPDLRRRTDSQQLLRAMGEYCGSLMAGERLPSLPQLMERFDASERAIMAALDELRRAGKIVRRNGVGTFVTDAGVPAPSPAARANNVIVAIARHDHSYFDRCMAMLARQVESSGLALICRSLAPDIGIDPDELAVGAPPLGTIFFGHEMAGVAAQVAARGERAVLVAMPMTSEPPGCPNIYSDRGQGDYLLTRHLLELGHRRFAYFPWNDQFAEAAAKRAGARCSGVSLSTALVDQWSQSPKLIPAFFKRPEAPTAVLTWNDHLAMRLLGLFSRAGLRVPDDVSVAGYDNLPEGSLVHPGLTTVDGDIQHQLQAALEILTASQPAARNRSLVIAPSLIRRESTGPALA